MRNTLYYPAEPAETIDALRRQADRILQEDLQTGRVGNLSPYLLKKAAEFIASDPEAFRTFTRNNP